MAKRIDRLGACVCVVLLFVGIGIYFYRVGWRTGTFTEGQATRIQYFESPPMLAVHIDGPSRVLVIRNINGKNHEDMQYWLNPENSNIESISVVADSIYNRWTNRTDDRDVLQFGVHGRVLKSPYPSQEPILALGLAIEDFLPGSFTVMTSADFDRARSDVPILDTKVWGRVTYSSHRHISLHKEPTGYHGP